MTVLWAVAMAGCSGSVNRSGSAGGYPPAGYPIGGETDMSFETLPTSHGCFDYHATTDEKAYSGGASVTLTVTATNVTGAPCQGYGCGGTVGGFVDGGYTVTDSHDHEVYTTFPAGVTCATNDPPLPMISPGVTATWTAYTWDQLSDFQPCMSTGRFCFRPRAQLPPGRYRMTWHWLGEVRAQTDWFAIEAS